MHPFSSVQRFSSRQLGEWYLSIVFTCNCGKPLRVDDHMSGKRVRCPKCKAIQTAPHAAEETHIAPKPRRQDADDEVQVDSEDECIETLEEESPKTASDNSITDAPPSPPTEISSYPVAKKLQ